MFEAKIDFDNFYKAVCSMQNVGRNAVITNDGNDWLELKVFDEDSYKFGNVVFKDPYVYTDLNHYTFCFNIDRLISVVKSVKGICKVVKIVVDADITFNFGEFILSLDLLDCVKNPKYSRDDVLKWLECGYYLNKENLCRFFKCSMYSNISFLHSTSNLRIICGCNQEKFVLTADISKSVWKMNRDFVGETCFDYYKTKCVLLPMINSFDTDEISIGFKKDYPLVCYVENSDLFVLTSLAPLGDLEKSDEDVEYEE